MFLEQVNEDFDIFSFPVEEITSGEYAKVEMYSPNNSPRVYLTQDGYSIVLSKKDIPEFVEKIKRFEN